MVAPAAKREVAAYLIRKRQLSQRRACGLAGMPTCSWRYQSRRKDDVGVRCRLKELAQERPRFGYRRLGVLLRCEGHRVSLKRVLRLYGEEGLKLRAKKRKRIASAQRVRPEAPTAVNQMWIRSGGTRFCGGYVELRAAFSWSKHRQLLQPPSLMHRSGYLSDGPTCRASVAKVGRNTRSATHDSSR